MQASSPMARFGAIVSALGGAVMLIGFCLPVFFTSPPSNTNFSNPYPPVINGWQSISLLSPLALLLPLALLILGTSVLAMLHNVSRPVTQLRTIAAIASVCVSLWFLEYAPLLNLNDSPDGAAASPTFSLGPGVPILLLGAVLSASGLGLVGIGAIVGAFIGGCIILIPFVGFLLLAYNGSLLASIIGSIIGGFTDRRIRRALLLKKASPS